MSEQTPFWKMFNGLTTVKIRINEPAISCNRVKWPEYVCIEVFTVTFVFSYKWCLIGQKSARRFLISSFFYASSNCVPCVLKIGS